MTTVYSLTKQENEGTRNAPNGSSGGLEAARRYGDGSTDRRLRGGKEAAQDGNGYPSSHLLGAMFTRFAWTCSKRKRASSSQACGRAFFFFLSCFRFLLRACNFLR